LLAAIAAPHTGAAQLGRLAKPQNKHAEALERTRIEPHSSHPSGTRPYAVCAAPSQGRFSCLSAVVPEKLASQRKTSLASPRLEGSGELGGYSPADLRAAYNVPFEGGKGLTIAITIAYDYPKAESDLATYRETYGLPPCTGASGCFQKLNQEGKAENYPEPSSDWSVEAANDLDMVSSMCPECNLVLVEAKDNKLANLPLAVDTAAEHGANVISDSWGAEERAEETALDPNLDHPGIPVVFSAGDSGYFAEYPASSRYVIAAGGTTLHQDPGARGWRETVWIEGGGGCSAYEEKPTWQTDTGCAKRTTADVSAVADPETPVSVYDTYGLYTGWLLVGGTSVAAPLWAGIEAHYGAKERSLGAALFWEDLGPEGKLYDVTEGRNGPCRPEPEYLCLAGLGYDGPTGWGSPGAPGRPAPPTVGTQDATGVTTSEATLNGAINPNGVETTYHFEYGPTSAYGTSVPAAAASAGSGTSAVQVPAPLSGLQREATYHYRLVATNALGTTYGGDHTFFTSPWSAQFMPRKHQREEMRGVSCASANFCVSVGYQQVKDEEEPCCSNAAPLAEHWDGSEWVRDSVPVYHRPAPGYGSSFEGVSCSSPDACMAVGANGEEHVGGSPLVEHWDGTQWSLVPVPLPSEAGRSEFGTHQVTLEGVSCVSASFCVAVGEFTKRFFSTTAHEEKTLVEVWNGSSWTVQPSPNLLEGEHEQNRLRGVSCVSETSCVAVGESTAEYKFPRTLIERWNGSQWSIDASPLAGNLQGVSCTSANACMAAGESLAEQWSGSAWTDMALEHPMRGVSCVSSAQCVAVGAELSYHKAYVEHWNGLAWSAESPARPTEASDEPMEFWGVSCVSTGSCTAVGWYYSWRYAPLAEVRHQLEGEVLPTVTKVEPATGPVGGGTRVTITGTGFKEVSAVMFGSTNATSFTVNSEGLITATAPTASGGTVDVTVTTTTGTSPTTAADRFTYTTALRAGVPEFFNNNVQLTLGSTPGFVAWGPLKFSSEALGAEWECVNLGFGRVYNEGIPPVGKGQIMAWSAQGDASAGGVETRRSCKFKKAGVEGEPEAWVSDEPALEGARKTPLNVPWNLQLVCVENEGVASALVRIGIPSGAPTTTGCRSEAQEAAAIAKEENERNGCYAIEVPEGCVRMDVVAPAIGLEASFEGTFDPKMRDGFANGLHPSTWELNGGPGLLHLRGTFATTSAVSGATKMVGLGSLQLITAK
jgi:hypothetical protein